jgi:hypothetical protein
MTIRLLQFEIRIQYNFKNWNEHKHLPYQTNFFTSVRLYNTIHFTGHWSELDWAVKTSFQPVIHLT